MQLGREVRGKEKTGKDRIVGARVERGLGVWSVAAGPPNSCPWCWNICLSAHAGEGSPSVALVHGLYFWENWNRLLDVAILSLIIIFRATVVCWEQNCISRSRRGWSKMWLWFVLDKYLLSTFYVWCTFTFVQLVFSAFLKLSNDTHFIDEENGAHSS